MKEGCPDSGRERSKVCVLRAAAGNFIYRQGGRCYIANVPPLKSSENCWIAPVTARSHQAELTGTTLEICDKIFIPLQIRLCTSKVNTATAISDLSAAAGGTHTESELHPFPQIPGLQLCPTPVFPQATPGIVLQGQGLT